MKQTEPHAIAKDLLSELESKFFWWEPVVAQPRSDARILAQAMSLGSFDVIRHLQNVVGAEFLTQTMLSAEPGWIDEKSWEFWRGRLSRATQRPIPETPPRRVLNAGSV